MGVEKVKERYMNHRQNYHLLIGTDSAVSPAIWHLVLATIVRVAKPGQRYHAPMRAAVYGQNRYVRCFIPMHASAKKFPGT